MITNEHLDVLTKDVLDKYWKNNARYIKYNFGLRLYQYAAGKVFDYSAHKNTDILPHEYELRSEIIGSIRKTKYTSSPAKRFQRLLIGYYGIFRNLSPFQSGLSSKEANERQSGTTADHIIGVTSVAEYVIQIFGSVKYLDVSENTDWSELDDEEIKEKIASMCNQWLPKHLWLWAQCRITKGEHKSDRLLRGTDMSVEQKMRLEHYNEAGIIVEKYY